MPCYDERNEPDYIIRENSKELGKLTESLCEACGRLEALGQISSVSGQTQRWWFAHKRQDEARQRKAEESRKLKQIAEKALRNLKPEEIEALQFIGRMTKK